MFFYAILYLATAYMGQSTYSLNPPPPPPPPANTNKKGGGGVIHSKVILVPQKILFHVLYLYFEFQIG